MAPCRAMLIADRKSKVKEGQVAIVRADKLQVTAAEDTPEKLASNLHSIMQAIPDIVVAGISTVRRAVIQSSQKKDNSGGALRSWTAACLLLHVRSTSVCWFLSHHIAPAVGVQQQALVRGWSSPWSNCVVDVQGLSTLSWSREQIFVP